MLPFKKFATRRIASLAAVPALLLAGACANTGASYQPVIDGPVGPNYSADLYSCQQIAASQGALGSDAAQNTAVAAGAAAAGTALVNNHFDTDGVLSMFAILHPDQALAGIYLG